MCNATHVFKVNIGTIIFPERKIHFLICLVTDGGLGLKRFFFKKLRKRPILDDRGAQNKRKKKKKEKRKMKCTSSTAEDGIDLCFLENFKACMNP